MAQKMTNNQIFNAKVNANRICLSIVILGFAILSMPVPPVGASSLYVSLDRFDHKVEIGNTTAISSPTGALIGASFDLADNYQLFLDYGRWDDSVNLQGGVVDFESNYMSAGIQRDIDSWSLALRYSRIDDLTMSMNLPDLIARTHSDMRQDSIRISLSKELPIDNWMLKPTFGLQYDDLESTTSTQGLPMLMNEDQSASTAFLGISSDYYLPITESQAWYFGGSLMWYEAISSSYDLDQDFVMDTPQDRRGQGRGRVTTQGGLDGVGTGNRTVGESFGILGLFATYQINSNWSLDLTTTHGFSGDFNSDSYSLTLAYDF